MKYFYPKLRQIIVNGLQSDFFFGKNMMFSPELSGFFFVKEMMF